ncbi:heme-binding protein [Mycobacterium sp. SMC-4]|uniref:heme-binding protein n=1 Tax=Mycobacterium sp. SMC-4 TaxID=2857059 RepID=UPI003D0018EF
MLSHRSFARRILMVSVAAGAVLIGTATPAPAQPPRPPNCTAADLSNIMSGITASTSAYLFAHPEVNEFMTTLGDRPREEKRVALGEYLNANPQVRDELQAIRQPAVDFRARCGE